MLNEPQLTIMGNLTGDPELRYTPTGIPTASFSVAQNPRYRNTATGEWEDGEPVFMRVQCWRDEAENVCQSLRRGDPVLVIGRVRQRTWTDNEDNPHRVTEVTADSVAVPLARRMVRLVRVTREQTPGPEGPQDASQDSPGADAGTDGPADEGAAARPAGGRKPKGAHAAK